MKRILLLALLLSSCAGPQTLTWFSRPGENHQWQVQDRAACNFAVNQAMMNYRYDASTPWSAGMGRSQGYAIAEGMFNDCMVSKGWNLNTYTEAK